MTGINTIEANKYWKNKGSETAYLDAISFVAPDVDEDSDELYISLNGDEEGNFDTKLTISAAKHVAKQLLDLISEIESNPKGFKTALLLEQEKAYSDFKKEMEEKAKTKPTLTSEPNYPNDPIGCDGCGKNDFNGEPIDENLYWDADKKVWLCHSCYEDAKEDDEE